MANRLLETREIGTQQADLATWRSRSIGEQREAHVGTTDVC
jgi:hypothetical protein